MGRLSKTGTHCTGVAMLTRIFPSRDPVASISLSRLKHMDRIPESIIIGAVASTSCQGEADRQRTGEERFSLRAADFTDVGLHRQSDTCVTRERGRAWASGAAGLRGSP